MLTDLGVHLSFIHLYSPDSRLICLIKGAGRQRTDVDWGHCLLSPPANRRLGTGRCIVSERLYSLSVWICITDVSEALERWRNVPGDVTGEGVAKGRRLLLDCDV